MWLQQYCPGCLFIYTHENLFFKNFCRYYTHPMMVNYYFTFNFYKL
jgi:hypothetical protein